MKKSNSYVFPEKWIEPLTTVSDHILAEVVRAVMAYWRKNELKELSSIAAVYFAFMKGDIDAIEDHSRRLSEKRQGAGRKGGLAAQEKRRCSIQSQAKRIKQKHNIIENEKIEKNIIDNELNGNSNIGDAETGENNFTESGFLESYLNNRVKLEAALITLHTDESTFREVARETVAEWTATGVAHSDFNDAAAHLLNQTRMKLYARKHNNGTTANDNGESHGQRSWTRLAKEPDCGLIE